MEREYNPAGISLIFTAEVLLLAGLDIRTFGYVVQERKAHQNGGQRIPSVRSNF
jgi:hypothetical protein